MKIFKPVLFLFPFVSEYGNESETKKNQIGLKVFKPKKNFELQHNTYARIDPQGENQSGSIVSLKNNVY